MQEGLGRLFNVIPVASGIHVSLKNATGVTFVIYEDGGATQIDFVQSIAGASGVTLTTVNKLYASNGIGGVWTRETSDASAALSNNAQIIKKDTTAFDCAAIYIGADELSAGYDSVECTVDAGVCIAIVHELVVQRAPESLVVSGV